MTKVLQESQGGMLFVDEAHGLKPSGVGDYKEEVLRTLIAAIGSEESEFYGKLLVVLAGYEPDMLKMLAADQGLSSRFPERVKLDNITTDACIGALNARLIKKVTDAGRRGPKTPLDEESIAVARAYFTERMALADFGNMRDVNNFADELYNCSIIRIRDEAKREADSTGEDCEDVKQRHLRGWNNLPVLADVRITCEKLIVSARKADKMKKISEQEKADMSVLSQRFASSSVPQRGEPTRTATATATAVATEASPAIENQQETETSNAVSLTPEQEARTLATQLLNARASVEGIDSYDAVEAKMEDLWSIITGTFYPCSPFFIIHTSIHSLLSSIPSSLLPFFTPSFPPSLFFFFPPFPASAAKSSAVSTLWLGASTRPV